LTVTIGDDAVASAAAQIPAIARGGPVGKSSDSANHGTAAITTGARTPSAPVSTSIARSSPA
jgi:hypothetical protein